MSDAVFALVIALGVFATILLAHRIAMFLIRLHERIEFLRKRQDEHRLCLEQLMVEHGKLPFTWPEWHGSDAKWMNKNEAQQSFRVRRILENMPMREL